MLTNGLDDGILAAAIGALKGSPADDRRSRPSSSCPRSTCTPRARRPPADGWSRCRSGTDSRSRSTPCSRPSRPRTRAIFLTNSEQPDGAVHPARRSGDHRATAHRGALVFVDEAYADFAGRDAHRRRAASQRSAERGRRAGRSRRPTASRACAPGRSSGTPATIAPLRRTVPPYTLNVGAGVALPAALADVEYSTGISSRCGASRDAALFSTLDRLGVTVRGRAARTSCWSRFGADLRAGHRRPGGPPGHHPRSVPRSRAARGARGSRPASSSTPSGASTRSRRSCAARHSQASHDRDVDRAAARRSKARAGTRSAPASGSSITCWSWSTRHGGFDLTLHGATATSTSTSTTPSRTSGSRSARRCRGARHAPGHQPGGLLRHADGRDARRRRYRSLRPRRTRSSIFGSRVATRRRSAVRARRRLLRRLRAGRPRQRAREGALRPLEPSPDRGGVQGVRARAARRRARATARWPGRCRARRGCCR